MQRVIQENANFIPTSESYFIPLTEDAIRNYLESESKNIKNMKDQLDFDKPTLLGKKKNLIYFEEGTRILAVYLEDYINNELDTYLANL